MAGNNLPPPQTPFVDALLNLSYDGYQYLLSLLNIASQAIPTATVDNSLTATGATQATALLLTKQWNVLSNVVSGTGVLLSNMQPGQTQTVFNDTDNQLLVYPPPGRAIDQLQFNIAYGLNARMMQVFYFTTDTTIFSSKF
jgi:hypothetical protein